MLFGGFSSKTYQKSKPRKSRAAKPHIRHPAQTTSPDAYMKHLDDGWTTYSSIIQAYISKRVLQVKAAMTLRTGMPSNRDLGHNFWIGQHYGLTVCAKKSQPFDDKLRNPMVASVCMIPK